MSAFDPETFMSDEVVGSNDTVILPVPEGDWPAIVQNFEVKERNSKDGSISHALNITWEIISDEVKAAIDRPTALVRQTVWLDLNEHNKLDMGKGKNVGLGKLRAALRMNDPNQPFSLSHLRGAGPALVKVSHRADQNNPEVKYADVKAVGALNT